MRSGSSATASALTVVVCLTAAQQAQIPTAPIEHVAHGPFYVRSYSGKCLTYGVSPGNEP